MPASYDPAAFHAFERAGWERVGAGYDDSFGLVTRQTAQPLLDAVGVRAGMRILDIACGPGYLAAAAAARGAEAIGLDFAASVVAGAQKLHPAATFRQGDAEALPFPDAHFDAVMCSFGVPHFPHPERALAEAFRVLKPGGHYAITDWTPGIPASLHGFFFAAMRENGDLSVPVPEGPPRGQFTDPAFCARMFGAAGFGTPALSSLPLVLRGTPPERVPDIILRGMVRLAGVFDRQTPAAQTAIRAAITASTRAYLQGSEALVPCPATLVLAQKP